MAYIRSYILGYIRSKEGSVGGVCNNKAYAIRTYGIHIY